MQQRPAVRSGYYLLLLLSLILLLFLLSSCFLSDFQLHLLHTELFLQAAWAHGEGRGGMPNHQPWVEEVELKSKDADSFSLQHWRLLRVSELSAARGFLQRFYNSIHFIITGCPITWKM